MAAASSGSAVQPSAADVVARAGLRELSRRNIASLWAGYGSVVEIQTDQGAVMLKHIVAESGTSVSHRRKVASYVNEARFYTDFAGQLLSEKGLNVPRPLLVETSAKNTESCTVLLLMEDLRASHPNPAGSLSVPELNVVVDWLADLHGHFWEAAPGTLCDQGSYWYLATRQSEFADMGSEWSRLRAAAGALERCLRGDLGDTNGSLRRRTVVHGDMKSANILFSADGQSAACYDFQYVGKGVGSMDLAYLFVSSAASAVVRQPATVDALLRRYHSRLLGHLTPTQRDAFPFAALRQQYLISVADYTRFMAGWGFWGNSDYASQVTSGVLDQLDGGAELGIAEYEAAIRREFPLAT